MVEEEAWVKAEDNTVADVAEGVIVTAVWVDGVAVTTA